MAAAAPAQGVAAQANVGPNVVMNANAGGLGAVEDDDDGVNEPAVGPNGECKSLFMLLPLIMFA